MSYRYKLEINGIERNTKDSHFKPNIIAEIVKDLDKIDANDELFVMTISKVRR